MQKDVTSILKNISRMHKLMYYLSGDLEFIHTTQANDTD